MSNQVVQLRGFRVPPRIHCPACQNYAWTMPMMQPVVFRNHFHHPSCPTFTPARAPRGLVRATALGAHATIGAMVSADVVMAAASAFDTDLRAFVDDINTNPIFFAIRRAGKSTEPALPPSANFKKVSAPSAADVATDAIVAKMSPDELAANQVWMSQEQALEYDWWGDSMGDLSWWKDKAALGRKTAGPFWKGNDLEVLNYMYGGNLAGLGAYKALEIKRDKTLSLSPSGAITTPTTIGQAELDQVNYFRSRLDQQRQAYGKLGYKLHSTLSPELKPNKTPWDDALTAIKWVSGAVVVGGLVYTVLRFIPKPAPSLAHASTIPAPEPTGVPQP